MMYKLYRLIAFLKVWLYKHCFKKQYYRQVGGYHLTWDITGD